MSYYISCGPNEEWYLPGSGYPPTGLCRPCPSQCIKSCSCSCSCLGKSRYKYILIRSLSKQISSFRPNAYNIAMQILILNNFVHQYTCIFLLSYVVRHSFIDEIGSNFPSLIRIHCLMFFDRTKEIKPT